MAVSGVRLHGVALLGHDSVRATTATNSGVLRFRELGALVSPAPYTLAEHTPGELALHRQVIDHAFHSGVVLPAPFGTVFRSMERVRRWLVQNYIALSEGIHFVAGRCEARLHIAPRETDPETDSSGPMHDMAECLRTLRQSAVASLQIRRVGATVVTAFLVEQERWSEFVEQVSEQAARHDELTFEQTGPWPPYDFVRLDFGA
jgi:hypothetical protein